MKYIWDTDTCIYYLNGNESVIDKTREVGVGEISVSCITVAELKYGAYNSKKIDFNLDRIVKLESFLTIISTIQSEITQEFGRIKAQLKKDGLIVGDFDLLIGCFAIVNNLILVTNNTKHYTNIPEIRLENWRT